MYLVDTNVWLERLLDQEKSEEVGRFLDRTPSDRVFMTDFAFHSIALAMHRLKKSDVLLAFVRDAFVDGNVRLVHLRPEDTVQILAAVESFRLDFDDAYQYVAAENRDLTLVSLDSDFDRTERGRTVPTEAVNEK